MDHLVTLCLPAGLDELIGRSGIGLDAPAITDDLRRLYVATILAAVVQGLEAPDVAVALVRLNGGLAILQERVH